MRTSEQSFRSDKVITHAEIAEVKRGHDFNLPKEIVPSQSPRKSPAGQYYLTCVNCHRCVFDDGTGSAMITTCGH